MTRKKVKLVRIANDTARKASFKKRRLGLIKKVRELTTLCGIYAFAVVYGPDDQTPVIWPSLSAAQHLYRRFHSLPLAERQKKMTNQETYLKERTAKAQDQLKKAVKKNQALEIDVLMNQLHTGRRISDFSTADLLGLLWMVEQRMRECRKRIEYHRQVNRLHPPPPPPPPPGFVSSDAPLLQTEPDLVHNGRGLVDQWFMDMVMDRDHNKIGATGCGMAAVELGFLQPDGLINGGVNPMMEIRGTFTVEEDNLLSEWNFDGTEIEKFASSINAAAGIDENACHQQRPYGIGCDHIGQYPDYGCGVGEIGGGDEAEMMMLNELFGNNEKLNGNEDEFVNKEWPNNFAP